MSHGDTILLNVVLSCELTKSSETKQLHFKSPPTTPLEIKKRIEENFSIPSCVQSLSYQSVILKDSDELQHTHFRSGDTFTVNYPIKGNCEMIQNVIQWLREIFKLFQAIEENDSLPDEEKDPSLSSHVHKIEDLILSGEEDGTILELSNFFHQLVGERTYVNKLHFQNEGGLDVLIKVYGLLVSKDLGDYGINSELHLYLEYSCVCAIANYGGCAVTKYGDSFPLARQVIKLGGLEMCLQTLLRKKVEKNGESEIHPGSLMESALLSALCAVTK